MAGFFPSSRQRVWMRMGKTSVRGSRFYARISRALQRGRGADKTIHLPLLHREGPVGLGSKVLILRVREQGGQPIGGIGAFHRANGDPLPVQLRQTVKRGLRFLARAGTRAQYQRHPDQDGQNPRASLIFIALRCIIWHSLKPGDDGEIRQQQYYYITGGVTYQVVTQRKPRQVVKRQVVVILRCRMCPHML